MEETVPPLQALCQCVADPVIEHFGKAVSVDLRLLLSRSEAVSDSENPVTGIKNGRVDPSRNPHMAHEMNRNGKYYCVDGASGMARIGAACDFRIAGLESDRLIDAKQKFICCQL